MRIKLRQVFLASTIFSVMPFVGGVVFAAPNDRPATEVPGQAAHAAGQTAAHTTGADKDLRSMQQRVEKRITELHASLNVTAQQQPQWDAFAKIMRDNAQRMDAALVTGANGLANMTATEQMQSYARVSEQHAKDVASLLPAFQALYDVMSPEQKLNADKHFRAQAQRAKQGKKG